MSLVQDPLLEPEPWKLDNYTWRGRGVLVSPMHQGCYDTCWAHSIDATTAAHLGIHSNITCRISKQYLLENCCPSETEPYAWRFVGSDACGIGALDLMMKDGLPTEGFHRWQNSIPSVKKFVPEEEKIFKLERYEKLIPYNNINIKKHVFTNPIIGGILFDRSVHSKLRADSVYRVDEKTFMDMYKNKKINETFYHAITITGWKKINGEKVWECLDSMGPSFADNGFIYVTMEPKSNELNPLVLACDLVGFKPSIEAQQIVTTWHDSGNGVYGLTRY